MAQLSNILALEKERDTIVRCRQIHLHLEGQFYHIYEWSAWLKPHRVYATRGTVGRIRAKLRALAESDRSRWSASLNSFCGVLSHGANYRLRRRLMLAVSAFAKYGVFDMEYRRYFSL